MSSLSILPCLNSPEMARQRRQELDVPRHQAKALGLSAVVAARDGQYQSSNGETVDWHDAVEAARAAKLSIPPDAPLPDAPKALLPETRVQVANETTLGGGVAHG
jgi:hypothetical protein